MLGIVFYLKEIMTKEKPKITEIVLMIGLVLLMVYLYSDGKDYKEIDTSEFSTNDSALVYFEIGSSVIKDSSFMFLADSISQFILSGHTDSSGIEEKNVTLSMLRVYEVAKLLRSKNSQIKIQYEFHSSSKPVADNLTEQGRKLNRRVEILWQKK
jgi:outer membrane protein OmpA-like peptidoglycan-associated protein